MKLTRMFSLASTRLREAIKTNDLKEVERLRGKKDQFVIFGLFNDDLPKISPEMADKLISFTDKEWERWGWDSNGRNTMIGALMGVAMEAGRADLFDRYMNSGASFNGGKASEHPVHSILEGKLTQDQKTEFTARIVRDGIDKIEKPESFLKDAALHECPGAFDVLAAALGDEIHKNNEELLRTTAQAGKKEMCRHLVEKHNCNIDLAVTTSRTLGHQDTWLFLDALRGELKPGDTAPPTIESLAAELTELKATVRAMANQLAERDREKRLDKPVLPAPSLKAN